MKKLLYIFLVSILALACTRQQIKISAINPATGEPYAGLNYTISKNVTGAFETNSHIVKKGTLNENGIALVTLNLSHYRSYVIGLESPGEHCYENNTSYTFSHNDKSFGFVFKIAPCAYIKFNIHNINCQGATDTMILEINYLTDPNYTVYLPTTIPGCYNNDGSFAKIPSGNYLVKWQVTKNGIVSNHDTTFFIPENGHYHLTINY